MHFLVSGPLSAAAGMNLIGPTNLRAASEEVSYYYYYNNLNEGCVFSLALPVRAQLETSRLTHLVITPSVEVLLVFGVGTTPSEMCLRRRWERRVFGFHWRFPCRPQMNDDADIISRAGEPVRWLLTSRW